MFYFNIKEEVNSMIIEKVHELYTCRSFIKKQYVKNLI